MIAGFRAASWAWILTAAAVALFCTAGTWQLRKGLAKEGLQTRLAERSAAAEPLTRASPVPQGLELRRAQATGTWIVERQLLQDGQSNQHRPGYHVWTPLLLDDGAALLVDRGWIPADRGGFDGSAPTGSVTVTGYFRSLPEPGLRLSTVNNCAPGAQFPVTVLYPTAAEVECLLQRPVLAGLLLQDPEQQGGFVREWTDFGFPPQRHYGYSVQWFALAAAAIGVFIAVNRKKRA